MKKFKREFLLTVAVFFTVGGGIYYHLTFKNNTLPLVTANSNITGSDQMAAVSEIPTSTPSPQNTYFSSQDVYVIQDDGTLVLSTGQVDTTAVAKAFYRLNPSKTNTYDFLSIFSTFHDPYTVEYHDPVQNSVQGIGEATTSSQGIFPSRLLGINYLDDSYIAKNIPNENTLKNNFFLLDHETGHQWLAYIGVDEGISTGVHYSVWLNNGFQRNGEWWGDVMQGSPWKRDSDGTFSVNNISHQGFSKFSLYLMGLAPLSDVSDLQLIVPQNPNNTSLQNVQGSLKTIKISDLIAKYGARVPTYNNSQKDFRMGYILLTKKGDTQYQSNLAILDWIANDFPAEWNLITYGISTMNKGSIPVTIAQFSTPTYSPIPTASPLNTSNISTTTNNGVANQSSRPSLVSITPSQGTSNTTVTISGTNLKDPDEVDFYDTNNLLQTDIPTKYTDSNGLQHNNIFVTSGGSSLQFVISGTMASNISGTFQVRVVTPSGSSNALPFTIVAPTTN